MYTKILAAFDNSPRGDRVFEAALNLAKANQASLMLLHILSRDSDDNPLRFSSKPIGRNADIDTVYTQEWKDFTKQTEERLNALMQLAMAEGVMAEFKQLEGSPGRTICDFARNWGADLIAIGRRGLSFESEMFIGSVSSYVIHRCNCSIHIVQQ
jgi:nucleotide-binding universal stress UspA family protein